MDRKAPHPDNAAALLGSLALFKGLPPEQVERLAVRATVRVYAPGEIIFMESERIRAFFVVARGAVKLYKSSPEGREQTLYVFGPGEPFCLCTAFEDDPFPANAAALEESTVVSFPGKDLEELARQEPSLLFNILLVLSRRLKESMRLIEDLALREIPQRLASFLLHELDREHPGCREGCRLTLTITQRELAKILGATPETLSRVLHRMADAGLIRPKGRTIEILDRAGLEDAKAGD
jgi:CRP/FNR family transcriptional regulator